MDTPSDPKITTAAENFSDILNHVAPLLKKIYLVFKGQAEVTVIVHSDQKPGCLVLQTNGQPDLPFLIKKIQETMEINSSNKISAMQKI